MSKSTEAKQVNVKKLIKSLRKEHRFFFYGANREVRSLGKISSAIFDEVVFELFFKGGIEKFLKINKGVSRPLDQKPVLIKIGKEFEAEFPKLISKNGVWRVLLFHNSMRNPLVIIELSK